MDGNLSFEPPGVDISTTAYESQASAILRRVRELCNWNRPTFPGSQPVSLSASNLKELGRKPYVACEKTDGLRYLFFAASGMVFLIDRKETIRVVEMKLPALDQNGSNELKTHQSTLLDGELVQDVLADGTSHICFLIYDLIALNRDSNVAKFNLLERLKLTLLEIVQPRAKYVEENPQAIEIEKKTNSFFAIYLKDFFEIWDVLAIRNAAKRLPHLSDGIIFTPVALPYVAGTCRSLLKWKPPELNTVDFAAVLVYAPDSNRDMVPIGAKLLIGNRGLRRDSGFWICTSRNNWPMVVERQRTHQDCDGCILECAFDPEAEILVPEFTEEDLSSQIRQWQADQNTKKKLKLEGDSSSTVDERNVCPYGRIKDSLNFYDFSKAEKVIGGWVVERIRTDKNSPNDERVMHRVKESIDSGIDFTTLFNAVLLFRETSKLKPLSAHCQLPEYYDTHGSRIAQTTADNELNKFAEQTEYIRQSIASRNNSTTPDTNDLGGLPLRKLEAIPALFAQNNPPPNNNGLLNSKLATASRNHDQADEMFEEVIPPENNVNERAQITVGTDAYTLDHDDDDDEIFDRKISSSSSEEE